MSNEQYVQINNDAVSIKKFLDRNGTVSQLSDDLISEQYPNARNFGTETKVYSANSISGGYLAQAGSRGYKVLGFMKDTPYDSELVTSVEAYGVIFIALSSFDGLEKGQSVSLRTTSQYVGFGTIESLISKNTPEFSGAVSHDYNIAAVITSYMGGNTFTLETDADDPEHFVIENYLTVDGHPELGDTIVAYNGLSLGEKCIAQERNSAAFGRDTKALGQYGFAANRGNTAGYAAAAFGYNNKSLGTYTFSAGYGNNVQGQYSVAFNHQNTVYGKDNAAFGTGNNIAIDYGETSFCFVTGSSNNINGGERNFVCGLNHSVEQGSNNFVANANNTLFFANYSSAFGQNNSINTGSTFSFVCGQNNMVIGDNRGTVFGYNNELYGCDTSFVCGVGNICRSNYAMRRGKYCTDDEAAINAYADMVGNGYITGAGEIVRRNAYKLDWNGNAWYMGNIETTGVIIASPSGIRYKITVEDNGTVSAVRA